MVYVNLEMPSRARFAYRIRVTFGGEVDGFLDVLPSGILWVPKFGKKNAGRRKRRSGELMWGKLTALTASQERADETLVRESARRSRASKRLKRTAR